MDLADRSTLKGLLARHGLWASKGLGQHFLVSHKVVDAIVAATRDARGILEIGPGPGVLTSPLSDQADKLIAIELDERMIAVLKESSPKAEVVRIDALKCDLDEVLGRLPKPRAIVSNLPYYITGPLLTRIAEAKRHYSKAVLMMQKEVADRVIAQPRTPARGSLSVFLQLQFQVRQLVAAPAGAFLPPPKVDSAVLEFIPTTSQVDDEEESAMFKLIRDGFTQPRKTLVNNLVSTQHVDRSAALEWISKLELKDTARPQELTNDQWIELHRARPKV